MKPDVFDNWQAQKTKKNDHPFVYADVLITAISFIRFKFHLSLRETEGFFRSFAAMINALLNVPSYTQICRRMKSFQIPTELLNKKSVTDIVFDTTGLKICGEGEWRATKYGGKKRWKKLHLALDPESGKLILAEITDEHVHDTALRPLRNS